MHRTETAEWRGRPAKQKSGSEIREQNRRKLRDKEREKEREGGGVRGVKRKRRLREDERRGWRTGL